MNTKTPFQKLVTALNRLLLRRRFRCVIAGLVFVSLLLPAAPAATADVIFLMRAPGIHGSSEQAPPTPPPCDAACKEGAWTQFFTDHGWSVPHPWADGFDLSSQGLTLIPDVPYPASVMTGTLNLYNNNLTNVDGLSSLTSVGGVLYLHSNNLTNVDGLSHLTSVGGDMALHSNNLTNVDGLSSLTSVGGNLYLHSNNLTNVDGLASLTSVGGNLYLYSNNLTNVDGLASLTSVGGTLVLYLNPYLVDLSGLSHLATIGKGVYIDTGIQNRPGFVPIQGGALCDPRNAGKYISGYASQSDVCAP